MATSDYSSMLTSDADWGLSFDGRSVYVVTTSNTSGTYGCFTSGSTSGASNTVTTTVGVANHSHTPPCEVCGEPSSYAAHTGLRAFYYCDECWLLVQKHAKRVGVAVSEAQPEKKEPVNVDKRDSLDWFREKMT